MRRKDPPPTTRGRYERTPPLRHLLWVRRLKAKPGEWMKLTTAETTASATGLAAKIRHGKYLAFAPRGTFEAFTRGLEVWSRYVG